MTTTGDVYPAVFADAQMNEDFWRDGFVQVPIQSAAALADLQASFARLEPFDGFDPRTMANARCPYHCTFLDDNLEYRRTSDLLVRRCFADPITEYLPGYEILTSNFYVKQPGTGRFEVHQNWPMLEDLDVPTMTVWVPLQDTTFQNGTVRVLRGGHHVFPDVAAGTSDRFFDDFEQELVISHLEPIEVKAGNALIFDDSLVHWSGDNLTDVPRITIQIEVIPVGAQAVLWVVNPDDPSEFELWGIDTEYWLTYKLESALGGRPEGLPLVGRRPNPNRRLTLEEFEGMMRSRDEIRRERYLARARS